MDCAIVWGGYHGKTCGLCAPYTGFKTCHVLKLVPYSRCPPYPMRRSHALPTPAMMTMTPTPAVFKSPVTATPVVVTITVAIDWVPIAITKHRGRNHHPRRDKHWRGNHDAWGAEHGSAIAHPPPRPQSSRSASATELLSSNTASITFWFMA